VSQRLIPAWSLTAEAALSIGIPAEWFEKVTRDWAIGGATGEGVDVCILDSGVDGGHPLVGGIESAVAVTLEAKRPRSWRTLWATCAVMALRARGSSARSRRLAGCTAFACSARGIPVAPI